MAYILIIIVMAVLAVLNAVVPLPGFNFFVPLFSSFMTTQEAITFITVYFLLNSSIIVYVFRKYIRYNLVVLLAPSSLIGAILGSALSSSLNELLLTIVVLLFVLYFTISKINNKNKNQIKKSSKKNSVFIGSISGFLQGGGFGGGDIRNSFLYAQNLNLQEVRATTATVGVTIFITSLITRYVNDSFTLDHIWLYAILLPIAIIAAFVGRHISTRLSSKIQYKIVISLMMTSVLLLIYKIYTLL